MPATEPPDTIFFVVNASLEQQLKALPNSPGVYLFKDVYGSVIYVGKAANLKKRTRNHFNTSSNLTLKTRHLMLATSNLDYFVTDSAQQALILECNLIKKFNPRYNVRLKDGKTFLVYWHDHSMTRTPTDLALNDKIELQEVVQHYQFRLSEHKKELDKIKAKQIDPVDKMIELEKWKSKEKTIQNNLQDWRNKATKNREEVKLLLADHF